MNEEPEERHGCYLYDVGHFSYALAVLNLVSGAVSIPVENLATGRKGAVIVVSMAARAELKRRRRGSWRGRLEGKKRLRV